MMNDETQSSRRERQVDLFDVARSCIRRWYVVIPLLAVTAWIAHSHYTSVKPVYYANAVVGAAPSNEQAQYNPDGSSIPRNGLLEVGGMELIMNLVVLGFDDPSVKERVVAGGGSDNFTVRMFPGGPSSGANQTQLPLIMIEATEPDQTSAVKTVGLAAAQTDSVLTGVQQQAGVPAFLMAKAIQASQPQSAGGTPSRNKSLLVTLMFGVGLAILGGVGVDALINRLQKWRRERRMPHSTMSETSDPAAKHSRPNEDARRSVSASQDAVVADPR
jgi:hypothetical protein